MEISLLIRPHRQAGRGHDMSMTVFRPFQSRQAEGHLQRRRGQDVCHRRVHPILHLLTCPGRCYGRVPDMSCRRRGHPVLHLAAHVRELEVERVHGQQREGGGDRDLRMSGDPSVARVTTTVPAVGRGSVPSKSRRRTWRGLGPARAGACRCRSSRRSSSSRLSSIAD